MSSLFASIFGGLGGMFGWGVSDFLANLGSDSIGHQRTFFWSQVAGMILLLVVCAIFLPSFAFTLPQLVMILFIGAMYAAGYLFFYKGFELGNVSVVSAVVNLQTVFVVLISFFIRKEHLGVVQVPALVLIFLGVMLVSVNFKELRQGTVSLLNGVKETLIAAVIFGVLFWPLDEYLIEQTNFLSITLLTKVVAILLVFLLSVLNRQEVRVKQATAKMIAIIAGVGVLETIGILSANFGVKFGDLILVAPISSSLTIVTVSLAVIFLKEKISRVQAVGIAMTIAGIILTAF